MQRRASEWRASCKRRPAAAAVSAAAAGGRRGGGVHACQHCARLVRHRRQVHAQVVQATSARRRVQQLLQHRVLEPRRRDRQRRVLVGVEQGARVRRELRRRGRRGGAGRVRGSGGRRCGCAAGSRRGRGGGSGRRSLHLGGLPGTNVHGHDGCCDAKVALHRGDVQRRRALVARQRSLKAVRLRARERRRARQQQRRRHLGLPRPCRKVERRAAKGVAAAKEALQPRVARRRRHRAAIAATRPEPRAAQHKGHARGRATLRTVMQCAAALRTHGSWRMHARAPFSAGARMENT
eukprot:357668-Chlamydomonas_euryale.AAC.2